MGQTPDVVVIGSGPNGLVAACTLARRGLSVLVLEANPRRPGGCLGSEELTLPRFVHDVGAAFFPMRDSPALRELDLESTGLRYVNAAFETCHPALDGSYAAISRDLDETAAHFGAPEDGERFFRLAAEHADIRASFEDALLGAPAWRALLRLGPRTLLRLLPVFLSSSGALSRRLFESEAARRVLPALGMHVDVAPRDRFGAALGYVLALGAATAGYAVPVGGAQSITNALVTVLERHGGSVRLGARVERILVREKRAVGIRLADGTEIEASRAVLADTAVTKLLLDLVGSEHLASGLVKRVRRLRPGPGTFKLDFALSAPVPWTCEVARRSAVVHTGESIDDLQRCSEQLRRGELPESPYLVIGQQSLLDPSRAPEGRHTLYCYTRVPSTLEGGWEQNAERFADAVTARIEGLAPGFSSTVLARHVTTPSDFEAQNANLVGGDIGGGDNAWTNQLVFRPFFGHSGYAMPVRGLYLCSSFAHPGAGVHGMCGYNAALRAARDVE